MIDAASTIICLSDAAYKQSVYLSTYDTYVLLHYLATNKSSESVVNIMQSLIALVTIMKFVNVLSMTIHNLCTFILFCKHTADTIRVQVFTMYLSPQGLYVLTTQSGYVCEVITCWRFHYPSVAYAVSTRLAKVAAMRRMTNMTGPL